MYSGTTLSPVSGRILGAHQKIDRVARHHLRILLENNRVFPSSREILRFEGWNGPDGIKRKSPARDEPWHFYSPFDDEDSMLVSLISQHYKLLVEALKKQDRIRSSFEAAWLAHALVDGLTPAHHYPFEQKLIELRGGEGNVGRVSIKQKAIMPGETPGEQIRNNWKMWGPKGLLSTHFLFELGVATLIAPLSLKDAAPSNKDIEEIDKVGLIKWFQWRAREIAVLDMYGRYYKRGWTLKLMLDVRQKLAPTIVKTVSVAWYKALIDAELVKVSKTKKL